MSRIFHEVRDFFRQLLSEIYYLIIFSKFFCKSFRFSYFREVFPKAIFAKMFGRKFRYTLIRLMICRPGAIMLWKKGHRVLTAGTMKVSLSSHIFADFLI
jgi:hypothetical protein